MTSAEDLGGSPTSALSAADAAEREALGLPSDATAHDVARTREALSSYLDAAPPELAGWAARQRDLGSASSTGRAHAPGLRALRPVLIVLLIAAVVVGVYRIGGGGAQEAATPSAASGPGSSVSVRPVDQAKVDDLTAKVNADPQDVASLESLGDLCFGAGEYAKAAEWKERVVTARPSDPDARLTLGVARFNGGDLAAAEKQWLEVLRLDPKKAEAYYDLGFLYMSQDPPRMDKAEASWAKVSELAPGSQMAKTVEGHVASLRRSATGGTPTGRPLPGASAPTTAANPAPTSTTATGGPATGGR